MSSESAISERIRKEKKNEDVGFENIQISYGNHLVKDPRKKSKKKPSSVKAISRKSKKKRKKGSQLRKKVSPKAKSSLKKKFKEIWNSKSQKSSLKSNQQFNSKKITAENKYKETLGSIFMTTEETGRTGKQSGSLVLKNAEDVLGLLHMLEHYKTTLNSTVALNKELVKKLKKNKK